MQTLTPWGRRCDWDYYCQVTPPAFHDAQRHKNGGRRPWIGRTFSEEATRLSGTQQRNDPVHAPAHVQERRLPLCGRIERRQRADIAQHIHDILVRQPIPPGVHGAENNPVRDDDQHFHVRF